jgi:catechol 2,3-dioxygenase-like lactoylglutathione lyase family enzyme
MKKSILISLSLASAFALGLFTMSFMTKTSKEKPKKEKSIRLGIFSVSLNVKDLQKSKDFYEKLGFSAMGGDMKENYLIMKNEKTIIGIFQGMFEGNILTFNPGWDVNAKNIKKFDDIRIIQKHLKSKQLTLLSEADTTTTGPASVMLTDPDGNLILFDQHR